MPDPAPPSEALPASRDAALAHLALLGVRGEHGRLERDGLAALQRHLPTARAELLTAGRDGWVLTASTDASRVGTAVPDEDSGALTGLSAETVSTCSDPLGDGSPCLVLTLPEDDRRVLLCRDEGHPGAGAEDLLRAVAAILHLSHGRRRAETERDAAESRFEAFAEHSPDAVFRLRLRPTERVEYLSPAFADLTGLSHEVLADSFEAWRALVPPEDLSVLTPPDELPEDPFRTEPYRIVRPDGTATWVETVLIPQRDSDGEITVICGATRDVTAARASNEALQRALEHERLASEELREISATKDALLSAISHELRTPLTVLRGFAELLLAHGDTLPASNRDAAVVALERNARRLDELLSSILDLDRLGRGAMMVTVRDLPLATLIEEVVAAMELGGRDIGIDVGELTIRGDRSKLERVLENLLANALKHGPPDTEVDVRAWPDEGGVIVAVDDRGRGVPDELSETVFEPFERGAADPEVSGTGLGLALVRGFIELHGGRTWVEHREGGGASFRLWLPDEPPAPDEDADADADADG